MSEALEVDSGDAEIMTVVNGKRRKVDMALWLDVHAQLADKYRSGGLVYPELDESIMAELPSALALALGESGTEH